MVSIHTFVSFFFKGEMFPLGEKATQWIQFLVNLDLLRIVCLLQLNVGGCAQVTRNCIRTDSD